MRLEWFSVDKVNGDKHLFQTYGDMPKIGDIIYLNNTIKTSNQHTKGIVISASRSIALCAFSFDSLTPTPPSWKSAHPSSDDATQRLEFACEFIEKTMHGRVTRMEIKEKRFIYTTDHGEILVQLEAEFNA